MKEAVIIIAELYAAITLTYKEPKLPDVATEHRKFTVGESKAHRDKRMAKAEAKRQRKLARQIRKKAQFTPVTNISKVTQNTPVTKVTPTRKVTNVSKEAHSPSMTVQASFYTAFCAEGCTGVTATGLDVSNTQYYKGARIIATDPRVIPLGSTGTLTLANGQTYRVIAQDTGGAIKGNRIDVLVAGEAEAVRLGRMSGTLTLD